jgi:hypothetical protein
MRIPLPPFSSVRLRIAIYNCYLHVWKEANEIRGYCCHRVARLILHTRFTISNEDQPRSYLLRHTLGCFGNNSGEKPILSSNELRIVRRDILRRITARPQESLAL